MSTQANAVSEITRLIGVIAEQEKEIATWKARAEKAEGDAKRWQKTAENYVGHVESAVAECDKALAALDAANALVGELREVIARILIGGNHLASALIHLLRTGGDKFPPYSADAETVHAAIPDGDKRDLWTCWAVMMQCRDSLRTLSTPTEALEALKERIQRDAVAEAFDTAAMAIYRTWAEALEEEAKARPDGPTSIAIEAVIRYLADLAAELRAQPVSNPYKLANHPETSNGAAVEA